MTFKVIGPETLSTPVALIGFRAARSDGTAAYHYAICNICGAHETRTEPFGNSWFADHRLCLVRETLNGALPRE